MDSVVFEARVHAEFFPARVIFDATDSARRALEELNNATTGEIIMPFLGSYSPINFQIESSTRKICVEGFIAKPVDMRILIVNAASGSQDGGQQLAELVYDENMPKVNHVSSGLLAVPWLERWFAAVLKKCILSTHEAIDQPVSAIFMVSATDEAVLAELDRMSSQLKSIPCFSENRFDSAIPAIYVLVHDLSKETTSATDAKAIFDNMISHFPAGKCFYLPVNSDVECGIDAIQEGIFKVPSNSDKFRSIGWMQIQAMKNIGESLVRNFTAPWMLTRFETIDSNISVKKRGLRNQFKNFWKRAGVVDEGIKRGDFSLADIEWQCRCAADLAFHLREYTVAAELYRSVASDSKQEGLFAVSAACYEMVSLCSFLSGAGQIDTVRYMDSAIDLYIKQLPQNIPCLVRAMVLHTLVQLDPFEKAAKLDYGNSSLSSLSGADRGALHEAVSVLYSLAKCTRKAAFQLVLAGHTYREAGLRSLALRCYRNVSEIIKDSSWMNIEDHLHFSLAKQLFASGDVEGCVKHFSSLFTDICIGQQINRKSVADKQGNYLKGLISVWKTSKPIMALDMTTPRFSFPSTDPLGRVKVVRGVVSAIDIEIWNPLLIPLEISQVAFRVDGSEVEALLTDSILINPNGIVRKQLSLRADQYGIFHSCCIYWLLNGAVSCKQQMTLNFEVDNINLSVDGLSHGPLPFGSIVNLDIKVTSSERGVDLSGLSVEDPTGISRLKLSRDTPDEKSVIASIIMDRIGVNVFEYVLKGRNSHRGIPNSQAFTFYCTQGVKLSSFAFISSAGMNKRTARVTIENVSPYLVEIPTLLRLGAVSKYVESFENMRVETLHPFESTTLLSREVIQIILDCGSAETSSAFDESMSLLYEYFSSRYMSSRSNVEKLQNAADNCFLVPTLFDVGLFWNCVPGPIGFVNKVTEDYVSSVKYDLQYPSEVGVGAEFTLSVWLSSGLSRPISVSSLGLDDADSSDYIWLGKIKTSHYGPVGYKLLEVMRVTGIAKRPGILPAPSLNLRFASWDGFEENTSLRTGRFVVAR